MIYRKRSLIISCSRNVVLEEVADTLMYRVKANGKNHYVFTTNTEKNA